MKNLYTVERIHPPKQWKQNEQEDININSHTFLSECKLECRLSWNGAYSCRHLLVSGQNPVQLPGNFYCPIFNNSVKLYRAQTVSLSFTNMSLELSRFLFLYSIFLTIFLKQRILSLDDKIKSYFTEILL